jgi:formate C-acetyltransferase
MTAMAVAVASVQCGYGNAVPIQLEVDPLEGASEAGRKTVEAFLRTYCNDLGGTLVNLNILDRETLLDAHRDPDKYPNLIVKVTGFSAYFATLSESFRQLVVDRLLTGL